MDISNKNKVWVLVGLLLSVFIYSWWHRVPHIDDAWIGEHAYWLSELGYVKSELMHGITQQHIRIIISHKLLVLMGKWSIDLFGFSLYSLKSISLVFLLLTMGVFAKTLKDRRMIPKAWIWQVVLFAFMANALIVEFGFVFRSEVMVMFMGFCSYLLLDRYFLSRKDALWPVFFSGVFAGLALLAHLNALIFIWAGGCILLYRKRWSATFIYSVGVLIIAAFYFYDFHSLSDAQLWKHQIIDSPNHSMHLQESLLVRFFYNFLDEQMRYFHSPREISLTLLLIYSLWILRKRKVKKMPILISYTLLLMLFMAFLVPQKTSKYALVFYPMVAMIIINAALVCKNVGEISFIKRNFFSNKAFGFLLVLFLSSNFIYSLRIASEKYYTAIENPKVLSYIEEAPKDLVIMTDMEFIFNNIEDFKRIQSALSYKHMKREDPSIKDIGFLRKCEADGIQYIFLNDRFVEVFELENYSKGTLISDDYLVLEHLKDWMVIKVLPNFKNKPPMDKQLSADTR